MMVNQLPPFISDKQQLPEITIKVVILAIGLTLLLAVSNTYLALKIGILTSASIPAAIISMGILRLFKNSNILENNLVQTAASAGEAVAGGIVYTIPALVIIHYWSGFGYWANFAIALGGGVLGVLFSVPLRRVLMSAKHLNFPEGRAIAEVLKAGTQRTFGMREMLWGSGVGAALELAQTGLKVIANNMQGWFIYGRTIIGFGGGFSATLVGAGYLIGFNVALSILIGAVIGWGVSIPCLSMLSALPPSGNAANLVAHVYSQKVHYIGIGAMLVAGMWTLLTLFRPLYTSIYLSIKELNYKNNPQPLQAIARTERDIPFHYLLAGIFLALLLLYCLFKQLFPFNLLGISPVFHTAFLMGSLFYILIVGFIFAAICGYFSGLVGVAASPGSAIVIASMLLVALIVRTIMGLSGAVLSHSQLLHGAAITIIVGAVITGAAAITNDNIQDLKVGHILGATPWKQQIMLLLGVLVAAAIIPPVMQILFNVYGIAGAFPHPGMDPSQMLAAPPAAMMAAISQGVFNHDLPWGLFLSGAVIIFIAIILNKLLEKRHHSLSILGIAIGIYLPLSSSIPLFIGGLIAWLVQRSLRKKQQNTDANRSQRGVLLACGLVSGAALMDVLLAVPMALSGNPDILNILPAQWSSLAMALGVLSVILLGIWFYWVVCNKKDLVA